MQKIEKKLTKVHVHHNLVSHTCTADLSHCTLSGPWLEIAVALFLLMCYGTCLYVCCTIATASGIMQMMLTTGFSVWQDLLPSSPMQTENNPVQTRGAVVYMWATGHSFCCCWWLSTIWMERTGGNLAVVRIRLSSSPYQLSWAGG